MPITHVRVVRHGVLDDVGHFRIVVVRTVDYAHSILNTPFVAQLLAGPKAETSQVGCDAGHVESHCFKRRIAPWLVI